MVRMTKEVICYGKSSMGGKRVFEQVRKTLKELWVMAR